MVCRRRSRLEERSGRAEDVDDPVRLIRDVEVVGRGRDRDTVDFLSRLAEDADTRLAQKDTCGVELVDHTTAGVGDPDVVRGVRRHSRGSGKCFGQLGDIFVADNTQGRHGR